MADDLVRVWDIIEKAGVGMLTTQSGGGLRARPLQPRPDREAGAIYFVTDVRGHKDAPYPTTCPSPTWTGWRAELLRRLGK